MSEQYPGGFISKTPPEPTATVARGLWTLSQAAGYAKQGLWPRSPGAPTIGTATIAGTVASVPFTAPTDTGSAAITAYVATSNTGGFTGTSATSPISVSGLIPLSSYTFTVVATNGAGTGPASAASNSVTAVIPSWILTLTGSVAQPFDMAVDSAGNLYASGTTAGSPNTDGLLVKITSDGAVLAKKTVTGSNYEQIESTEIDSSGNIFLFGYNIPTGAAQGQALVMKLNSSYGITWQKKFEFTSNPGDEDPATGGIDSSGNVYFAYGVSTSGRRRGAVAKLASNGGVQYTRQFYPSGAIDTYVRYGVVDSSGNLYVNITSLNNSPFQIRQVTMKVDNAGNPVWIRTLSKSGANTSASEGQSIAIDSSGNVYVVATGDFGGRNAGVVAKYNSSGTIQWQRALSSASKALLLEGVAVDSSGNVYAVGKDDSNNRAAIFKFNSAGTLQWQNQIYYTGASNTIRGCVVVGSYIYLSGFSSSALVGANLFKLNVDGSGAGTYGSWTYSSNNYSSDTGDFTETSFSYTFDGIEADSADTSLSIGDKTLTETLTTF